MTSNYGAVALLEPPPPSLDPAQPGSAQERPTRVLLVEDDPDAAVLAMSSLCDDHSEPFSVEWVSTLWKAMKRLEEPGVDVILLDLGLPELTGYRSFRAIEAAAAHTVPVVMLTADDRMDTRRMILEFGASDYLLKGYVTSPQLRTSLRRAAELGWPKREPRLYS